MYIIVTIHFSPKLHHMCVGFLFLITLHVSSLTARKKKKVIEKIKINKKIGTQGVHVVSHWVEEEVLETRVLSYT